MELAILGAIGLLGYNMAPDKQSRTEVREQPLVKNAQAYPFGPGTTVQKAMDEDRRATQARWQQAQGPFKTGVITPNTKPGDMMPFFRSACKQNTNDAVKQRRMELATGALDMSCSQTGTYRKKKEVPAMFKPEWTATAVTSGGSGGSVPFGMDQSTRYVPSQKQNNVLPTQQQRVGPGLGVGMDVAASDGFHPMLRVMPKNVGEYKKNNLEGRVVPGGAPVATRPMDVDMPQFKPPTFWDMARYPLGPGKAAVNARSERPAIPQVGCGGRVVGDDYFGGAGRKGTYAGHTTASRDRYDNNLATHETNVTGSRHGVGGFVNATHDIAKIQAQQREQIGQYDGVLTGDTAPKAPEMYIMPNTARDVHKADATGNPASAVEGGRARPMDPLDRTLREHLHTEGQPGIAAPYIKGHTVTGTDKWLDREAKRYGQHLVNWMPSPHMATDARVPGIVQITPKQQVERAHVMPTVPTPSARAPPGATTTTYNKLPTQNGRLDLSIARTQLAANPLHVSVS